MKESLKSKTIKGVSWNAAENIINHGVSFIVGIVLARLLTPDDYGLIGIVTIFTVISTALINGGFTTALIRKKNVTDDDYSTSFISNISISLFLYLVIFFCSPSISLFFGREELVNLIRVSSIGLIIGSFALVQQTRLTKSINFKSQTQITVAASLASGIIGICMAFLGCGVWSLVAQTLSANTIRTVLLWIVNKWTPSLSFSKSSFNELFGFGWKMMLSSLLESIWKELYQVVVGKFYSSATLGQYTRSKQFSQIFSTNITIVIQRVSYPVLSSIQDEKERMSIIYRRLIKMTMFVTAICMFFLGAVAEPLLYCLIGPKWHDAATFLPVICISGSLYPLQAINLNMLQIQGRSDLFLGIEIIKKILAIVPLTVGIFYGIFPMLYINIINSIIAFFLNSYFSGKFINYSSIMQIKDVAPSFGIATVMALSVYFLKYLPLSYWIVLPIQFVLGFSIFLFICKKFKIEQFDELLSIIKPFYSRITLGQKNQNN